MRIVDNVLDECGEMLEHDGIENDQRQLNVTTMSQARLAHLEGRCDLRCELQY